MSERDESTGNAAGSEFLPQLEKKHPDEYMDDLSPNRMAGQNVGPDPRDRERPVPTAYDAKQLHRALAELDDDELKQIPILPVGERLEQGATYIDLAESRPREFKSNATAEARAGHFYVPKDRVPYEIWNRLIGEEHREGRRQD